MKILSIVGARPQFIKAAPVSHELRKTCTEILVHTGQHYDTNMSQLFFEQLNIPTPDYNLGIGSANHGQQTGQMLIQIEKLLLKEKPKYVLVYGDTNSTLAGALAASKLHIPIGHVEAGLRSKDKTMPEEINRIIADHCAHHLFAPTETAVTNLHNENIQTNIFLTGDVMVDALYSYQHHAKKTQILNKHDLQSKKYLLITIHRPSNTDNQENLINILTALTEAQEPVIFPIHPRTQKTIQKHNLQQYIGSNIRIIPPLGYLDFISLEFHARMILTDSGGIQKEAYIQKIPCITLRTTTEWVETIQDKWNILVGANKDKILDGIKSFNPLNKQRQLFGKGNAHKEITHIISKIK